MNRERKFQAGKLKRRRSSFDKQTKILDTPITGCCHLGHIKCRTERQVQDSPLSKVCRGKNDGHCNSKRTTLIYSLTIVYDTLRLRHTLNEKKQTIPPPNASIIDTPTILKRSLAPKAVNEIGERAIPSCNGVHKGQRREELELRDEQECQCSRRPTDAGMRRPVGRVDVAGDCRRYGLVREA